MSEPRTEVDGKVLLEARGVTKKFPGVVALNDVSFKIYSGKVNALVGENGAGKSTLMKILSGVYQDYEGQILLDGKEVSFANTREAQESGIAIIHQELNLFPYLSVAENVFLGREYLDKMGFVDYQRMYKETTRILKKLELDIDPKVTVSKLRVGQQQIVEIAKALSLNARVIIMDEPTSAISEHEIEVLFRLIKNLTAQGVAVVYITHKLDELFQIGDVITVLRDGKVITASRPIQGLTHDDVVRMMVGREWSEHFSFESPRGQKRELFRIEDLCLSHPDIPWQYLVNRVSFSVKQGEVLGVFGLMGAGRTELLETIFGLHPDASSGSVFLNGKKIDIKSPQDAITAGIGFIPEDRKEQGLILQLSVGMNVSLASLKAAERAYLLRTKLEDELVETYIEKLNIKTPSLEQLAENLSGGNQQKVVIAKWLATHPKILLMDEPTRGIDVNAKREIYNLINELVQGGIGIVMVSSELPEILGVADRIVVMSEGRKTAELRKEEASKEAIMKAAIPRKRGQNRPEMSPA